MYRIVIDRRHFLYRFDKILRCFFQVIPNDNFDIKPRFKIFKLNQPK